MKIRSTTTVVVAMTLALAACTSSSDGESGDTDAVAITTAPTIATATSPPKGGPITMVTKVLTSAGDGMFEVTKGADVPSGTIRDHGGPPRVMTCDSGPNEGSFTVTRPTFAFRDSDWVGNTWRSVLELSGDWSVLEGNGDFVGLDGDGKWTVVFATGPDEGVGTWTGHIDYNLLSRP